MPRAGGGSPPACDEALRCPRPCGCRPRWRACARSGSEGSSVPLRPWAHPPAPPALLFFLRLRMSACPSRRARARSNFDCGAGASAYGWSFRRGGPRGRSRVPRWPQLVISRSRAVLSVLCPAMYRRSRCRKRRPRPPPALAVFHHARWTRSWRRTKGSREGPPVAEPEDDLAGGTLLGQWRRRRPRGHVAFVFFALVHRPPPPCRDPSRSGAIDRPPPCSRRRHA